MPHFMSLVDNTSLGALNFTDGDMRPTQHAFTIKAVERRKPPNGKGEKPCIVFEETPKVWFISTGQLKRLANMIMIADYSRWTGVTVVLTCAPVKALGGGETMGIVIVSAERPSARQPSASAANANPQAK